MKTKNERKMGEGMVVAVLALLCMAVIFAVYAINRPEKEILYPVHVVPEGFADAAKININAASAEELDELPGIGETLARRIIAYRGESGGFESIEDIMLVDGVGEGIFAEIKDKITTGR